VATASVAASLATLSLAIERARVVKTGDPEER
jgi:hypothetical protein